MKTSVTATSVKVVTEVVNSVVVVDEVGVVVVSSVLVAVTVSVWVRVVTSTAVLIYAGGFLANVVTHVLSSSTTGAV